MSGRLPFVGIPDAWAATWRGPLVLAIVMVLPIIGLMAGLRFRIDLSSMLPEGHPRASAFARFTEQGGPGEWLALRIGAAAEETPEKGHEERRRVAMRIRDHWLAFDEIELPRSPNPAQLLAVFPATDSRSRWRAEISSGELGARLARNLRRLRVGGLATTGEAFAADPFGLLLEAASPWLSSLQSFSGEAAPELAGSDDGLVISGSHVWVLLWSSVPAGDAPREFLSRVRHVAEAEAGNLPWQIFGGYRYRELAEAGIRRELTRLLPLALAAVLTVLMVGMRSLMAPITCLVPVLAALLILLSGFAVTGAAFQPSHLAALILMVGLAVDAAIHLRVVSRSGPGSGIVAWICAGRGIRAALATSVVGFAMLLFSEFPAIRQMGAFLPTGLLLAAGLLWILFPTLNRFEIRRTDSLQRKTEEPPGTSEGASVRRGAALVAVILIAAHLLPIGPLDFSGDLRKGDPWRQIAIDPLLELGAVDWTWWSMENAQARPHPDRERWRRALEQLLRERRVRPEILEESLQRTLDVLEGPSAVVRRLRQEGVAFLALPALATGSELEGVGWVRVDAAALLQEVEESSRAELLRTGIWMLLGVVFLLALMLPSRRCIAVALFPPFVALTGTLLLVRVMGDSINPLGITLLPLLFGISLDDALHLILHTRGPGARSRVSRGVILTTLTTIAAIGTLTLSESPALSSLGTLTIPAMLIACGATLFGIRGGGR